MKKTTLVSLIASFAVTATMLTAGFPAYAVSMTDATNGVLTVSDTETAPNTLTFTKEIAVFNDDAENVNSVYGPTITYNYKIEPYTVSASDTVTDANGVTVAAKSGIDEGVTLTDAVARFVSESVELDNGMAVIHDDLTASVNLAVFETAGAGAGIYRYKITEALSDDARESAGVTRDSDNYSRIRYLDVYLKNTDDGLAVSAYVMFHVGSNESTTIDGTEEATAATDTQKKTTGYDSGDNNGEAPSTNGDGNMGDKYYTYNYEVEKEITGSLADKTHKFQFLIETTASANAGQKFNIIKPETPANTTEEGEIGTNISVDLADGDKIRITGLPATATVKVTETNNTADTYKTTIEGQNVTDATVASGATIGFDAKALTNYTVEGKTKPDQTAGLDSTKFINKLEDISPTGVILTVAPYAFMLGAACFFIALYLKNKKREEAGTMI